MKTIIAGSRRISYEQEQEIIELLNKFTIWDITQVVCGMAKGVDSVGKVWAESKNIPVIRMYPNYEKYGPKRAPYIRNHDMAVYADRLIAFWDGISPGTKNMINIAKHLSIPTAIYTI